MGFIPLISWRCPYTQFFHVIGAKDLCMAMRCLFFKRNHHSPASCHSHRKTKAMKMTCFAGGSEAEMTPTVWMRRIGGYLVIRPPMKPHLGSNLPTWQCAGRPRCGRFAHRCQGRALQTLAPQRWCGEKHVLVDNLSNYNHMYIYICIYTLYTIYCK